MKGPHAPKRSARRADWRGARFASLDFEATGLDLRRDHVVSYGIVPVDEGRIQMAASVYGLAHPPIAPSPGSVTVHGLRSQDLQGAGEPSDVSSALASALDDRFLITWFAPIENSFLDRMFPTRRGTAGWISRNVDVRGLVLQESTRPADEKLTLSGAAKRYGVPVSDPHNALDDALVTAQLFLILATRMAGRGLGSVAELLKAARTTSVSPGGGRV